MVNILPWGGDLADCVCRPDEVIWVVGREMVNSLPYGGNFPLYLGRMRRCVRVVSDIGCSSSYGGGSVISGAPHLMVGVLGKSGAPNHMVGVLGISGAPHLITSHLLYNKIIIHSK